MKKIFAIMLSLTLVLSVFSYMPVTVNATETTVTDGATNLKWSDDLLCTWDIGTNPKVNGTDVYGLSVCLESSTDGISFSKRNERWIPGTERTSYDFRNDISTVLKTDKYYRFKIGYYLTYDGSPVVYSEYSDVLDLSAATAYDKPTDLKITDTTVSWKEVSGADTYSVIVRSNASSYKKTTITHNISCNIGPELEEAKAAGELYVDIIVLAGNVETEYTKSTTKFPSQYASTYINIPNAYVGGVLVTNANKDNILGDGTASYDFETNTLTLNNANITNHLNYDWVSFSIYSQYDVLNVVLIGNNTISLTNPPLDYDDAYGIFTAGNLNISGPGSLTINTESSGYVYQYGIYSCEVCTIKDTTINIVSHGNSQFASGFTASGATTFENVKMNIDTTAVNLTEDGRIGAFRVYRNPLILNGNSIVNIHTKSPYNEYVATVDLGDLELNAGCFNIESTDVVHMKLNESDVNVESEIVKKAQCFEPDRIMFSSSKANTTVTEPTCTKGGCTTFSCPICKESVVYNETPATAIHNFGTNEKTCSDCGIDNPNYVEPKPPVSNDDIKPQLKDQKITTAKIKTYKVSALKKKAVKIKLKAKASGKGKLTYKVKSTPKGMKKFITVSKKGVVTLKKKAKKGTYKITITAAAKGNFKKATKTITIKVK